MAALMEVAKTKKNSILSVLFNVCYISLILSGGSLEFNIIFVSSPTNVDIPIIHSVFLKVQPRKIEFSKKIPDSKSILLLAFDTYDPLFPVPDP